MYLLILSITMIIIPFILVKISDYLYKNIPKWKIRLDTDSFFLCIIIFIGVLGTIVTGSLSFIMNTNFICKPKAEQNQIKYNTLISAINNKDLSKNQFLIKEINDWNNEFINEKYIRENKLISSMSYPAWVYEGTNIIDLRDYYK